MMETAEPGHRYNPAAHTGVGHCFTTRRSFLCQREMRPVLVVVTDVLVHQASEMPFIQNNHVVEQIATAVANPSFGDTILPRTSEAGSLRLDAEVLHRVDYFIIELRAAIKNQVARRRIVRKRLAQLLDEVADAAWFSHTTTSTAFRWNRSGP